VFVGLLILVFNIDRIPSERLRMVFISIFCMLLLIEVVYRMYKDIVSDVYTTTKYIALLYGIKIVAFIILLYFYFVADHQINPNVWMNSQDHIMVTIMFLSCVELIIGFLKSEKFIKPCENDLDANKM
jgi:uncharacterized membrane protein